MKNIQNLVALLGVALVVIFFFLSPAPDQAIPAHGQAAIPWMVNTYATNCVRLAYQQYHDDVAWCNTWLLNGTYRHQLCLDHAQDTLAYNYFVCTGRL